jgi:hypothetical protein
MQDGTPTKKATATKATTEIKPMKFILSFLIVTTALSADTCLKLSLGNAALTPAALCAPVNIFTPVTPIKCDSPTVQIPTEAVIKCNVPTIVPTPTPIVSKCTPVPVLCPTPATPVIDCPKVSTNPKDCDPTPKIPTSAVPEPSSYALLGAGLMTAGLARKFRKN